MLADPANWLVAIPVLTITVIKLIWGADLVSTSALAAKRVSEALSDGALWLGLFLTCMGLFMSGAIGFILLSRPQGTTPAWFGVGMTAACVFAVISWYLLTFQEVDDDE